MAKKGAGAVKIPSDYAELILAECMVCHLEDEVLFIPDPENPLRICASCAGMILGAFRADSKVPKEV